MCSGEGLSKDTGPESVNQEPQLEVFHNSTVETLLTSTLVRIILSVSGLSIAMPNLEYLWWCTQPVAVVFGIAGVSTKDCLVSLAGCGLGSEAVDRC